MAGPSAASPIPLDGPLFDGAQVRVGWPRPDEFDRITDLRNRDASPIPDTAPVPTIT